MHELHNNCIFSSLGLKRKQQAHQTTRVGTTAGGRQAHQTTRVGMAAGAGKTIRSQGSARPRGAGKHIRPQGSARPRGPARPSDHKGRHDRGGPASTSDHKGRHGRGGRQDHQTTRVGTAAGGRQAHQTTRVGTAAGAGKTIRPQGSARPRGPARASDHKGQYFIIPVVCIGKQKLCIYVSTHLLFLFNYNVLKLLFIERTYRLANVSRVYSEVTILKGRR